MISRDKLIAAAAHVYAESGYRGATTRRIADEAGVNEITIFRLFGSKAALIEEALRSRSGVHTGDVPLLPKVPADPERELAAWAAVHMTMLRADRVLIRKTMGELEERPEMAPTLCGGWCDADTELREYSRRLRRHRMIDTDDGGIKVDLDVAVSMFSAALFADAMGRDVMPEMYPQPVERAPVMYVRCFLRAIGYRRAVAARAPRRAAASEASRATGSGGGRATSRATFRTSASTRS